VCHCGLIPDEEREDEAHEFLYLNHGAKPGDRGWNWGPVGSVNGALLFRDALDYFMSELAFGKPQQE
jgi:hypothetical protein